MTLPPRAHDILGVCSLVHHAEPSVRYGHACAEDRMDRRDGASAPGRREPLRGAGRGTTGEPGTDLEAPEGPDEALQAYRQVCGVALAGLDDGVTRRF